MSSTEVGYRYSLFVSESVGLGHASVKKPVLECTNDSLNKLTFATPKELMAITYVLIMKLSAVHVF